MITFEIDELTPCLKDMFGQTSSLEKDEFQEIVDRYVEENGLYDCFVPPRISVRKYLQYVEEHQITDPSEIPDEVLDTFMLPERPERVAL